MPPAFGHQKASCVVAVGLVHHTPLFLSAESLFPHVSHFWTGRELEREILVLQINGCAGLPTKVDPEGTGALRCGPSASFSTGARAVCGPQSILSVEERGAPCPFEGF